MEIFRSLNPEPEDWNGEMLAIIFSSAYSSSTYPGGTYESRSRCLRRDRRVRRVCRQHRHCSTVDPAGSADAIDPRGKEIHPAGQGPGRNRIREIADAPRRFHARHENHREENDERTDSAS